MEGLRLPGLAKNQLGVVVDVGLEHAVGSMVPETLGIVVGY